MITAQQSIALDVIFALLGESRFNRTMDEYASIATQAPKLAVMHAEINALLRDMAKTGYAPHEICNFKKGDLYPRYEKFPASLSMETVRKAWVNSGMRALQLEAI